MPKSIDNLTHDEARRTNIPTAELQTILKDEIVKSVPVDFGKRNPDLDPQLVWRGKYDGDENLIVKAPPLYIQEKVHPKALIEDLKRESLKQKVASSYDYSLFADFNGFAKDANKTDFYKHDQNWTNRMILGDSLQVMASLAEREGLRGQVQCIYMDPPYGIKFNSNFQWSTTSRDVKDGKRESMTREPEQVKAFRDTWRDGIHSYLSYLRDRFILAKELLADSGSIFVQIGDENVHRVKAVLDEIFGDKNSVTQIAFVKTTGQSDNLLASVLDYILWYTKSIDFFEKKYHQLFIKKKIDGEGGSAYRKIILPDGSRRVLSKDEIAGIINIPKDTKVYRIDNLSSQRTAQGADIRQYDYQNIKYSPSSGTFKTDLIGLNRLKMASRLEPSKKNLYYVRMLNDFPAFPQTNNWNDTVIAGFSSDKRYVVETSTKIIERCILMSTDPGDLVLDPTCGSGTTAYVAEQWGRRWITIDTSRVALALARARIMGARYPWYLMVDSKDGRMKEAELSGVAPSSAPTGNSIRQGFVYERVPHITLKSIANNAEIDVIYDKWQKIMEPIREALNKELGRHWEEWEIPREPEMSWPDEVKQLHAQWWEARIARQKEIDLSISQHADYEKLYDKPYEDKNIVRVAGPFTVESLSPHRMLYVAANGDVFDPLSPDEDGENPDFVTMILENLKNAGVQQAHREDKIEFTDILPVSGRMICAEGRYMEGEEERRAAIFIGPEFGTVSRPDMNKATREAGELGYEMLICCAFNYDAQASEYADAVGRVTVLKARMNADLHMASDLKNNGKGNLFVVFGEPDIEIQDAGDGRIIVKILGVDVYDPNKGEVRSDNADGIACWFVDTDYNAESFFVRQAYFLGSNDPYKALKTTLKDEIDRDAWESLHSDTSRPFAKPESGQIAVKVINHLGDEVLKVFDVK